MAQNPANVHFGPGRVFFDVPAPTTGNPPTFVSHTAGVPDGGGTEVGYTLGDLTFNVSKETNDITAEQVQGAIAVQRTNSMVTVEFEAMERTYLNLKVAFDTDGGTLNDVNRIAIWGGGQAVPLATHTVFVSSLRPNQPGKYEISMIYKGVTVSGYQIAYKKSGASVFHVTIRGLFDGTRDDGDRLYQHFIEK